jgi:D-alanine-D-alanine ligase
MALIERGISGRELEVAVLGNPPTHETSRVGEVIVSDDFYSYDAKYAANSNSQVKIPADIDEMTESQIRQLASDAYEALGCRGLTRVDFFLADDGTIYLNELNTLPGFTNISMYPKLWREQGVTYSQLVERLIALAIDETQPIEVIDED